MIPETATHRHWRRVDVVQPPISVTLCYSLNVTEIGKPPRQLRAALWRLQASDLHKREEKMIIRYILRGKMEVERSRQAKRS